MIWKSVTLENYLPFGHVGNKHVKIDFDQPACAILGGNGSGKSSLLRALTVFPAVRTDYGPNGKIIKVLSHNGSIYELTSDFKNSTAPHSFKVDDVEKNLSGTTETQMDLIEENFGITKLIGNLLAGNVKICRTGKAERKSLFSSLYPGDLSFVLEYHKKVCSQIRACGNQLKLLKSREAELRSSIIDESTRTRLEKFKIGATEVIDKIDKCSLLMENECERYEKGAHFKEQLIHTYQGWNKLDVRDEIACLSDDVLRGFRRTGIRRKLRDDFGYESIAVIGNRHLDTARTTRDRIKSLTTQIEEVRDELNKFIQAREANESINEKNKLEERFSICQKELDEVILSINQHNQSVVDVSKLEGIEGDLIPYVKNWVESIHSSSGSIKTKDEVVSLGIKIQHAILALSTELKDDLAAVTSEMQTVKAKLERLQNNPYPKDCVQVCPLRNAVADNIESTTNRWNDLANRKKVLLEQAAESQKFVNENNPIYEEQSQLHTSISNLICHLRDYGADSVAFNGEDPIDCCNQHCYEILNRLVQACETTRLHSRKQCLVNEMESIRHTLSTMASTKQLQMSIDLIENTIKDREEKLNQGIDEIERLERLANKEQKTGDYIIEISQKYQLLNERIHDAEMLLNQERVDDFVHFNEDILRDLSVAKQDISEELYKVSKTLQDQQKYTDIIESELIPTMNKVQHDKEVYESIADGLSPTSGLPCIYLIRFINRILSRANEIIKSVWTSSLELKYLEEGKDLDFLIPVIFRSSTVVKDISECSMGQQAIIDLSVIIALCIERGFLEWSPICLDEVDAALTDQHRTMLVDYLNKILDNGTVKQMFLVNHFAIQTGLCKCDNVVLHPEGIILPEVYNEHVEIE